MNQSPHQGHLRNQSWLPIHRIPLFCAGLSLGLASVLVLPRVLDLTRVSGWFPAYYYVNYYRFGFVKRALVGTLLTPLNVISGMDVRLFAVLVFSVGLMAFTILFWKLFSEATSASGWLTAGMRWRLALMFAFSPAIFLHLAYDAGRTDVFWLSCGIAALLIAFSKSLPFLFKFLSVLLLSFASLLIYEGSVFVIVPFLSVVLERSDRRRGLAAALVYALLMTLLTLAIQHFGSFEGGSAVLVELLSGTAPGLGDPLSIVLTGDLVKDNFHHALGSQFNWFGNNPVILAYILGWVLLLVRLARASSDLLRSGLILTTPFFGLFLNIIALDYIRYLSLVLCVSAMSILGLLVFDPVAARGLQGRVPLLWMLLLGIVLGPFGVVPDPALPYNPLSFILSGGG